MTVALTIFADDGFDVSREATETAWPLRVTVYDKNGDTKTECASIYLNRRRATELHRKLGELIELDRKMSA